MSIFKRFDGSLVNLIEWNQTQDGAIVYHFPRYQDVVAYGAKLIVGPEQSVIFVTDGKVADAFGPGQHRLDHESLPKLSKLQSWPEDSESGFVADIYFFNSKGMLNLNWGDDASIITDAKEAFVASGSYRVSIKKPDVFLSEVAGSGGLDIERTCQLLSGRLLKALADILREKPELCTADIASNIPFLAGKIKRMVLPGFSQFGLLLDDVLIDDIKKLGSSEFNESVSTESEAEQVDTNSVNSVEKEVSLNNTVIEDKEDKDELLEELPKIYYLMVLGERVGPLNKNDILEQLKTDNVDESTLYWHKGLSGWIELKNLIG